MKLLLVAVFALLIAVPVAAQEQAVHGYVNFVDNNVFYMTADDGRPLIVDMSAAQVSPSAKKPGEVVLVFGTATGPNNLRATRIIADRDRAQATSLPSGWQAVHGKVEKVDGTRLQFRADDNRVLTVDLAKVDPNVQKAVQQGDSITVIGEAAAQTPQLFAARYIQSDRTAAVLAQTTASANVPGGWQRIHGQVQSVQGTTLTLKADDGRMLTVDMAQVTPSVQKALTQNEGVEVIGHFKGDPQHVAARWIQQDSSNPRRGGKVTSQPVPASPAPAASPPTQAKVDEKAWQRIHGKVEALQGTTFRLKADDGRMLQVDMSAVSAPVQRAITNGEGVLVIGHFAKDKDHVKAQYIEQDRAGPAASPKTDKK